MLSEVRSQCGHFRAKKSSPKKGKRSDIKCGLGGRSVGRSDPCPSSLDDHRGREIWPQDNKGLRLSAIALKFSFATRPFVRLIAWFKF